MCTISWHIVVLLTTSGKSPVTESLDRPRQLKDPGSYIISHWVKDMVCFTRETEKDMKKETDFEQI